MSGRRREIERGIVTEAEGQAGSDPAPLLLHVEGRLTGRNLRLEGCACVRRLGHRVADGPSRLVVEVSRRLADGLAFEEEWGADPCSSDLPPGQESSR